MSADLEFYFDFSSPYAYFASTRIDQMAARYGRRVHWSPVLMAALFKVTGSVPLPSVPVKGAYILFDLERTARHHGIAYRKPANFPILSLAAARAMLWIDAVQGNARAAQFAKDCLRAYFAEGIDITDDNELLRLAEGLDVDPAALLVGIKSPEAKEMFQRASNAALEKGVFGSPFVLVDGEPFWGFDHFDQLEACLAGQSQR